MKAFLVVCISLFLYSCQGNDGQKEASQREAQKELNLFTVLDKEWHFDFPNTTLKVHKTLKEWNEWQQFKNELSQKPKTSLSAFKSKIGNVVTKSDSLQLKAPDNYQIPSVKSRLLTLDTQIKNLNMYLQLQQVPSEKIVPLITQINKEISGLYSQFEEIETLKNIPFENRETQMIEAIDTTRNASTNSMMERMENDEKASKKEFDSIKGARILNQKQISVNR